MNKMKFRVKGVAPLIMHNGDAANPFGQYSAALKKLNSKRGKTEDDIRELLDVQFLSGLYVDAKGAPCVPSTVVEATIVNGAKKTRDGSKAKLGVFCDDDWPLIFKGPKTAAKLQADHKFRFDHMVHIPPGPSGKSVLSRRPIFREWELEFVLLFDPKVVDDDMLEKFVENAGSLVGFCDWRPKFGRFEISGTPKQM